MNQEQLNRYTASLYRMVFLLKMVDMEINTIAQFKGPSGVRNELHRLKTVYENGIANLKMYMPNSSDKFQQHIDQSDEKICACLNIIEKIMMLEEEDVLKLEDEFEKMITVQY